MATRYDIYAAVFAKKPNDDFLKLLALDRATGRTTTIDYLTESYKFYHSLNSAVQTRLQDPALDLETKSQLLDTYAWSTKAQAQLQKLSTLVQ